MGRLDAGLKEGIDEDELVARQIGLPDVSKMSTTQEKYKDRIKEKLLEVCTPCSTVLILTGFLAANAAKCVKYMSTSAAAVCLMVNELIVRCKRLIV